MRAADHEFCPLQRTAQLLTRRWMPLVLRELMGGPCRFNDIRRALPRMSPGLLTQRLRELEDAGLVARRPANGSGHQAYQLTPAGAELRAVIDGMGAWGRRWLERRISRQDYDAGSLMWDIRSRLPRSRLPGHRVTVHFCFTDAPPDLKEFWLVLDGGVDLCLRDPGHAVDLEVRTDVVTLAGVWLRDVAYGAALRGGSLTVSGATELRRGFPHWLGLGLSASRDSVVPSLRQQPRHVRAGRAPRHR